MIFGRCSVSLQDQIDNARGNIRTDSYEMSIGEWISIYERDEIDIHPEFQRVYRWTLTQKSRFVESILLGIPIPPIFVVQRDDGVWDVVDGVQRLSTIFQLANVLKKPNGSFDEPLILEKTKYLPDLEGKQWESENKNDELSRTEKLFILRSRLSISIILKESDQIVQYELFQRLNTGGSRLSDQEIRNCIIVMHNTDFYEWLCSLNDYQPFKDCISLTDKAESEQYDIELALRFILFRKMDEEKYNSIRDVGEFITDETLSILRDPNFNRGKEEEAFKSTFDFISAHLNGNAFRRFDITQNQYKGGFLLSAYETIALGIGYNIGDISKIDKVDIVSLAQSIWRLDNFINNSWSGKCASQRLPRLLQLGRTLFSV